MFLPRRDFDIDYDHPDFRMSWPRILGTLVALPPMLLLAGLIVLVVALAWRTAPLDRDDPLRLALARARKV